MHFILILNNLPNLKSDTNTLYEVVLNLTYFLNLKYKQKFKHYSINN